MLSRSRISLLLAIALALLTTVPVFAGGWAVITLDELPTQAVAGEPLTVGFTVRQHGRTSMTGLSPTVTAILGEEKLVFPAEAEGGPGHYTATMTLPKAGDWQWAIEAFTMYQPMPKLLVVAANNSCYGSLAAASARSVPVSSGDARAGTDRGAHWNSTPEQTDHDDDCCLSCSWFCLAGRRNGCVIQ